MELDELPQKQNIPPPLMKHSLASLSSVAEVMVQKYVDGLPLTRQEKIWAREGLALSRATMANWVIQTAQTWLKPLHRLLKKQLLSSNVIHADETVVQVLKEDGKPAASESRMWIYASSERGGFPERLYRLSGDGRICWVQLDGRRGTVRLLGAHAAEVAGGHAEGGDEGEL